MNKIILLIFFVFNSNLFAQKFGYVNSEFILNNMKEYKEAMTDARIYGKEQFELGNKVYKSKLEYEQIERLTK